jgi:hypothetical protein
VADSFKLNTPVFRYYWKVIYDPVTKLGVALIGVNDPHMQQSEVASVKICDPIDHSFVQGLSQPDDIYKGVIFACTVEDAKKTITEIPDLEIVGVLASSATGRKAISFFSLYICLVFSMIPYWNC